MNMETVIKVNGVVSQFIAPNTILQYGRKKRIYLKSGKLVERDVVNGKFRSTKFK